MKKVSFKLFWLETSTGKQHAFVLPFDFLQLEERPPYMSICSMVSTFEENLKESNTDKCKVCLKREKEFLQNCA